ncbi:hypothetical protein D9611_014264 [Ephemerocybe angulata]|uniref:Uncharacterized protein n=1 Tax=Ephemerocybe angulata TaxID=980116 RepID=A0A8H5F9N5_9AGAR|nr:hypothetical protein D9611_014264 [Tulosesus angulatus]
MRHQPQNLIFTITPCGDFANGPDGKIFQQTCSGLCYDDYVVKDLSLFDVEYVKGFNVQQQRHGDLDFPHRIVIWRCNCWEAVCLVLGCGSGGWRSGEDGFLLTERGEPDAKEEPIGLLEGEVGEVGPAAEWFAGGYSAEETGDWGVAVAAEPLGWVVSEETPIVV